MKLRQALFFPRSRFAEDYVLCAVAAAGLRGIWETAAGWRVYLQRPLSPAAAVRWRRLGARPLAVAARNWSAYGRRRLRPIPLTRRAVVLPDRRRYLGPHLLRLQIPPGQAFGTGDHATTALTARLLEEEILSRPAEERRRLRLLDVGTGSGILAILAAKLGVGRCLGLDVDRLALEAAERNVRRNRVSAAVAVSGQPLEKVRGRYPLLAANILSQTLIRFRPHFARLVPSGGALLLSGILASQGAEIERAFGRQFRLERRLSRGEWLAYRYRKKPRPRSQ